MKDLSREEIVERVISRIETAEENFPKMIKLGRLTQEEADNRLGMDRAILKLLRNGSSNGHNPPPPAAKPPREQKKDPRRERLEAALVEIVRCTERSRASCLSCLSIYNLLTEILFPEQKGLTKGKEIA